MLTSAKINMDQGGDRLNIEGTIRVDGHEIPADVTFGTPGAEAGNAITVSAQLQNADGVDLANAATVGIGITTDSGGNTAGSVNALAAGTDGTGHVLAAGIYSMMRSEADGDLDLVVTKNDAGTVYPVVDLPTGRRIVGPALVFA